MYSYEKYNSKHEFEMREKQIAEDIVGIVENTDLEALHEVKAKNTYLVVMDQEISFEVIGLDRL